jgi:hypothetical protein
MRNLIIAAVGDNSLHTKWIEDKVNFDLALIYYGNDSSLSEQFKRDAAYFSQQKGQKFKLIKEFIFEYQDILEKYDYIWMPDDDIILSSSEINELFEIAHEFDLDLCQPAMKGYLSHGITKPGLFTYLRYTNFVEVLAPLMSVNALKESLPNFDISISGWGLEFYWTRVLKYSIVKVAIVDKIIMNHTRPVGTDYSRFLVHPMVELSELNARFEFSLNLKNFRKNLKVKRRVYKVFKLTVTI